MRISLWVSAAGMGFRIKVDAVLSRRQIFCSKSCFSGSTLPQRTLFSAFASSCRCYRTFLPSLLPWLLLRLPSHVVAFIARQSLFPHAQYGWELLSPDQSTSPPRSLVLFEITASLHAVTERSFYSHELTQLSANSTPTKIGTVLRTTEHTRR